MGNQSSSNPNLSASVKTDPESIKILIVDDHAINRLVIQKILSRLGYAADVACNGQEALTALRQRLYHLIFMDLDSGIKRNQGLAKVAQNAPMPDDRGMNINQTPRDAEADLATFRHRVYESFPYRADALLDTVDALSGNTQASSVAELSLSPLFGREYGSLYDGIDTYSLFLQRPGLQPASQRPKLAKLVMPYVAKPAVRPFWLLATDGTPVPRPYARTLTERTYVYAPNPTPGVKPVTLGHQA